MPQNVCRSLPKIAANIKTVKGNISLLGTCQQAHAEGIPVLYGTPTFYFEESNFKNSSILFRYGCEKTSFTLNVRKRTKTEDPEDVLEVVEEQYSTLGYHDVKLWLENSGPLGRRSVRLIFFAFPKTEDLMFGTGRYLMSLERWEETDTTCKVDKQWRMRLTI